MANIGSHCGIVIGHSLHDAYGGMNSEQHRGKEGAGIWGKSNERIDVLKWVGPVSAFDLGELYHSFFPVERGYHTFGGHVRYATAGRKDRILEDAHPHVVGGEVHHRGDHIYITNCQAAIIHNGQVAEEHLPGIDFNKLGTRCDSLGLLHYYLEHGEKNVIRDVPGAYTAAIADLKRKDVLVLRDRFGMRLGEVALKDGKACVFSEDIAARENGATWVEELARGSVYYLDPNGGWEKEVVLEGRRKLCHFEFNYIASPHSTILGSSVGFMRGGFGVRAAKEITTKADFVTYVPRCPEPAAVRFSSETGIPLMRVFYKKNAERSFQGSTEDDRAVSIDSNLFLTPGVEKLIRGKRGVVFEDSFVRGNVGRRVRHLLCDIAEVEEVLFFSYTPPVGIIGTDFVPRGCAFGIDMPPDDKFIARSEDGESNRTLEEIAEAMKFGQNEETSSPNRLLVQYLSNKGMMSVFRNSGIDPDSLCTFCIGGKHPFEE